MALISCCVILVLSSLLTIQVSAMRSAADYLVHTLPGSPPGPLPKMHAGYVELAPRQNSNLFFWMFDAKYETDRTILWLNGGPGCSSMDGALLEIGPFRVKNETHLEHNKGAWNTFANLLVLDQPVGTGFSYGEYENYVQDMDEMADQVVDFLESFFAIFPLYKNNRLYIAGESMAGQYIPHIARKILVHNQVHSENVWNLQGLLIGNGWVSGKEHYLSYLPFAYAKGLVEPGSGNAQRLEDMQENCSALWDQGSHIQPSDVDVSPCRKILHELLQLTTTSFDNITWCINMYDIRLTDTYPDCGTNWPPTISSLETYLNLPDVLKALHCDSEGPRKWQECSPAVVSALTGGSQSAIELLPELLQHMPILLYSGNQDLVANHYGTERIFHSIRSGGESPKLEWTCDGNLAGSFQISNNLSYGLIHDASHMAPFDQPERTRDMVNRFMNLSDSRVCETGEMSCQLRIGEKRFIRSCENSFAAQESPILYEYKQKDFYGRLLLGVGITACFSGSMTFLILKYSERRFRYSTCS